MSERGYIEKKTILIIAVSWVLSLLTTLAVVYFAPNIFPPIQTANIGDLTVTTSKIADAAIITTKLPMVL